MSNAEPTTESRRASRARRHPWRTALGLSAVLGIILGAFRWWAAGVFMEGVVVAVLGTLLLSCVLGLLLMRYADDLDHLAQEHPWRYAAITGVGFAVVLGGVQLILETRLPLALVTAAAAGTTWAVLTGISFRAERSSKTSPRREP